MINSSFISDQAKVPTAATVDQAPAAGSTIGKFSFASAVRCCLVANTTTQVMYYKLNNPDAVVSATDFQGIIQNNQCRNICMEAGTNIKSINVFFPTSSTMTNYSITGTTD